MGTNYPVCVLVTPNADYEEYYNDCVSGIKKLTSAT